MKHLLELFFRFTKWLGLDWFEFAPTPFDDYAHAGKVAGKVLSTEELSYLRILRLIISKSDCLITDTSRWQTVINYVMMVLAGIKGTILKCGQGYGIDPYFRQNYAKAKAAGLKRGTYWYYDSRVPPEEQAKTWADAIKDDQGELPHFADYEERYNGPYEGIVYFTIFVKRFLELSGLPDSRFGVYTGYYYWVSMGVDSPFWRRFWLWLAWYGPATNVLLPKPWTQERLLLWQFTDNGDGTKFGVSSLNIDLNYFVKGLDEYERMFGDTPDVPPTGEPMEGLFEVWSDVYYMSLRSAPNATATKVGTSLPRGTKVKADKITPQDSGGIAGDKWAHVIERDGQAVDLWMAIIHNGTTYCQYREISTRPVPHMTVEFVDRDGATWVLDGDMVERS